MLGLVLFVVAIVAVVFASIWSYQGYGVELCVGVAVTFSLLLVFTPNFIPVVPVGPLVVFIASLIVISYAQKAKFRKVAEGVDDEPSPGAYHGGYGYPYPQADPATQPTHCPVCQSSGMQWVPEHGRWYCQSCRDYR